MVTELTLTPFTKLVCNIRCTDKLSFTAGYMFIGYEVISPLANFHYFYILFTNGPFQNAGVKLNYAFQSIMVGAFNDSWNSYKVIQ
jgi:hypothetical protein